MVGWTANVVPEGPAWGSVVKTNDEATSVMLNELLVAEVTPVAVAVNTRFSAYAVA